MLEIHKDEWGTNWVHYNREIVGYIFHSLLSSKYAMHFMVAYSIDFQIELLIAIQDYIKNNPKKLSTD